MHPRKHIRASVVCNDESAPTIVLIEPRVLVSSVMHETRYVYVHVRCFNPHVIPVLYERYIRYLYLNCTTGNVQLPLK